MKFKTLEEIQGAKMAQLIKYCKEHKVKWAKTKRDELVQIVQDHWSNQEEPEEDDEPVTETQKSTPPVEETQDNVKQSETKVQEFKAALKVELTRINETEKSDDPSDYRQVLEVEDLFENFEENVPLQQLGLAYMDVFNELFPTEQPAKKAKKKAVKKTGESGKRGRKKAVKVELTDEMKAVISDAKMGKSAKFRALHDLGLSVSQIQEEMGERHYSFPHGVIKRYKLEKAAKANQPEVENEPEPQDSSEEE